MNVTVCWPPSLALPLEGGGDYAGVSRLLLSLCKPCLGVSDGLGLLPPPSRGRAREGGAEKHCADRWHG